MKGTFIISLDFELYWRIHDKFSHEACEPLMPGARKAVPKLLSLFQQHKVRATWTTVGFYLLLANMI